MPLLPRWVSPILPASGGVWSARGLANAGGLACEHSGILGWGAVKVLRPASTRLGTDSTYSAFGWRSASGAAIKSRRVLRLQPLRRLMAAPHRGNTEYGCYFITASTFQKRNILQSERMPGLFLEVLFHYRRRNEYLLHEFVVMPDHFHLMISPANALKEPCS
jgi:hypothetical protein